MKTNNSIIKSIARLVSVVLLMAVGVGQMWGAAVASLTPTDGKYYIIALYHDSKYYALPHIGSTGNLYCGEECTLNGSNQVTAIAGETSPYDCLWLLTSAGSAGQFYISYDNNGTRMYLYKNGTTGASNYNISATSPVSSTNHKWEFTSGTANSVTAYSVKSLKSGASANTVLRGDDITLQNDETCYGFNVDGTSNSYEITLLPVQPLTVTFDAEGGSCATSSLPEASSNAGVTLPEASPSDACESDGWEFAGWATSAVTEQNTSPRLFSAGDTYYPLDYGTSLHAVYRKLTSGTSTATFDASDRSDLTQVSMKVYNPGWYIHTATNMDLYIKGYGYYSNTWDLDNTWGAGGLGEAYIDAHTKIASIAVTLKSGTVLLGSVSTNNGSAELSGSGTSQSITCSGNVTRVTMYAPDSKETQITSLEVTYYNAKFNSNPSCCAYEVSYSESGSSHLAAVNGMTFSSSSIATCGDAASRTITITVTPASGYSLFGTTKPVFTKTSGTVTATIGSVTDNGDGTFSYECTFNSNDNGAGTFAISPGQFSNYRTTCSTTYDITLDKNGGDADGSAKVDANGTQLKSISAPTKTGYKVEGYYAESGKTNKVAATDGTLEKSVEISSTDWTNSDGEWVKGSDATFFAKWDPISYEVRFNKNNGSATGTMSNESYDYDESKALTTNAFSLTGYTFQGWATTSDGSVAHTDGKSVSNLSTTDGAVVDLYAVWTANKYTLTLAATNETSSVGSQTVQATYGSAMPLKTTADKTPAVAAPSRTGYTFDGWEYSSTQYYSYNAGTSTLSSAHAWDVASTATLTPRWNVNSYTLTWDKNGGNALTGDYTSGSVNYGATITAPNTPTRSGYDFAGWDDGSGVVTPATTMPAGDVTYTATWTKKSASGWTWTYNSAAIPDPLVLYVGINKTLDITWDPSDLLSEKKGYTVTKTDSKVAQGGKGNDYYTMRGAAGVTEVTNTTVTFSLSGLSDVEVNVTVKPQPRVHFVDKIHGESFDDLLPTVVSYVATFVKATPTHSDVSDPGSNYNTCERQHLHLVGWILSTWADANPGASPSQITGAGSGKYYAAGADINVETHDGDTFYAVWSKVE